MKLRLPLNLKAAVMAAFSLLSFTDSSFAANTGNSISVNFGSNLEASDKLTAGAVEVLGNKWNNTDNLPNGVKWYLGDNSGKSTSSSINWGSSGTFSRNWDANGATLNDEMMTRYLDDQNFASVGKGPHLVMSNLEYLFYDVYIYCNTPRAGFAAKTVNGVSYTYDQSGVLIEGAGSWGNTSNKSTLVEAGNYMRISLGGQNLDIYGGGREDDTKRGAISGIQIVETNQYAGVYETATLADASSTEWMVTDDASPWFIESTKTNWADSTGIGNGEKSHIAKVAVTGTATLSLKSDETAIMDGLFLDSGILNVTNGNVKLINHSAFKVDGQNSVLNLNTTVTSDNSIHLVGDGLVVLQKDQTWKNVYGGSRLQLDANLTINGDSTFSSGVVLSGSGHIYMEGNGVLRIAKNSSLSGEGVIHANKGVVLFDSAEWFTNADLIKKIDVTSTGAIGFDLRPDSIHEFAPLISSGSFNMAFYNTGGASGDDAGLSLDLSKTTFDNQIILKAGILNYGSSQLVNSDGKSIELVLDGGGILSASTEAAVIIGNDLVVNEAGGYIRDKVAQSSTYTGKISGSGLLRHVDAGKVTFSGDMSQFNGSYTLEAGETVFDANLRVGTVEAKRGTTIIFNNKVDMNGHLRVGEQNTTKAKLVISQNSNVVQKGGEFTLHSTDADINGKYSGIGTVSLGFASKLNLKEGAELTSDKFFTSTATTSGDDNLSSFLNVEKGATLTVLGKLSDDAAPSDKGKNSVIFGSEGNVNSRNSIFGTFNAIDAVAYVGSNESKIVSLDINEGAFFNAKGLNILFNTNNKIITITKGVLNLGDKGLYAKEVDSVVNVNGATMGVLSNYTIASNIKLDITGADGLIFNTNIYDPTGKVYTGSGGEIIASSVISQKEGITGKIVKTGNGVLTLKGNNTFTGGVTLESGGLVLGNVNALGVAGSRNLTITGDAMIGTESGIADKTVDTLSISGSSLLNLGGSGVVSVLNVGTLSGKATFEMDLLADGKNDALTMSTLAADSSITINLLLSAGSIGKTYTLINGFADASQIDLNGYRDTLRLEEGKDAGGNYTVKVGGTITSGKAVWQGATASGTWKLGDADSWDNASGGYYQADNVVFNAPAEVAGEGKFQTVTLSGVLAPNSVKVTTAENKNYLFTGAGSLTGGMTLTKEGEGLLKIDAGMACDYTGMTTVKEGILEFGKGAFIGTGDIIVAKDASLKVHEVLENKLTVNGNFILALDGAVTTDLKKFSKLTSSAESSLVIAKGAVMDTATMFKGKTISVENGGAFDLAGVNRNTQRFNIELAGQGVLVNGVYTGALFNSGGVIYDGNSGIDSVKVVENAMLKVEGGSISGSYSQGKRYDIFGSIDLNEKTLTKSGTGGFFARKDSLSSTVNGILKISEGFICVQDTDFGSSGSATKATVELLSGAGMTMYTNNTVYANVVLNSSNTDLTRDYVARNYANIFSMASDTGNTANYAGGVTLDKSGVVMLGWGSGDSGSNIAFSGQLSGTGILYVDASGTVLKEDSDTSTNRMRHLYLGAEVIHSDNQPLLTIQMVGKASVLQLSTVNVGGATALKNATIDDGLKIVGSDVNIIKIITTGNQAVTYTGLDFGITAGLERGMELRIQAENTVNSQWTTLNNTLGTLQKINLKARGKLEIGGTSNLKVKDDFLIDGETAEFILSGGTLTIGKKVEVAGTSTFTLSGNGTRMTVGNDFNLLGVDSKVTLSGGSLIVEGRGRMKGGSQFEISGDDTVFESKGINTSNRDRGFQLQDQGAVLTISGGTVTLAGRTGIGVGDAYVATGNHGTINQSGGKVKMTQVWMSEWGNSGFVSYYNLTNGVMDVSKDFQVGNNGSAELNISGGVANIKQINLSDSNNDDLKSNVNLSGTGRLNLGSGGLVGSSALGANSEKSVNLSGGTLGATEDWETRAELTLMSAIASPDGVTVDTTLAKDAGGAAKIKWNGVIKDHKDGAGKLNVTGTGILELGGTNSFTGDVTVKGNSTLMLNTTNGLSAKVILQNEGIFRMGGDNMTATSAFEVEGGRLILDKMGASVGNVTVKGGKLEMSLAGVKAGEVSVTSGFANISADASLSKLAISGGSTNITAGVLSVADSKIDLSGNGLLKFSGAGNVASGMIVNAGDNSIVSLGQLSGADGALAAYQFKLNGSGNLEVNDPALKSSYSGDATQFRGKVKVGAGELTLSGLMTQATAEVTDDGQLIFTGDKEQVSALGGTGKVSFSNNKVNITQAALFAGFDGMLVIGNKATSTNQVKFSYNGAGLLGATTTLFFTGNNGELTLNNTTGTFLESVSNVIMDTDGTIRLTGTGMKLKLNGDSWKGKNEEVLPFLIFDVADMNSNFVYVDEDASELDIRRLKFKTSEGVNVGVVKDETGKLFADVPVELTMNSGGSLVQSYTLSLNHAPTGDHILDGDTKVRSLSITSSDTATIKNTGLVLESGVKLAIDLGELYIAGDAAYTISGGSMGFNSQPTNDALGHFYIKQDARGGATISTTLDDTAYTFHKAGAEELVMSGALHNRGGVQVDSGRLVLTGTSQKYANAGLTNKGELVLGNGEKSYTVNYSKLTSSAGCTTTFSKNSVLASDFVVDNAGQLKLQMGTVSRFDSAFTGTGTTLIEKNTHITLPSGATQNFTVENGSSLTVTFSAAGSPGAKMGGAGEIKLENTTGSDLVLSPENMSKTSWLGFTGSLKMLSDQIMTLNLSLMGDGASVLVSNNGRLNDIATESTARKYQVTLGDHATWQLKSGVGYEGSLALSASGSGMLTQTGTVSFASNISGGLLQVQGGMLTMSGNNSHSATEVGGNTTVIGTSSTAFGKSLVLSQAGASAQVNGEIVTESLTVEAESARLEILSDRTLTVRGATEFSGILEGEGVLILETASTLGGSAENFSGSLYLSGGGQFDLTSDMGTAEIYVSGANTKLNMTGNAFLGNNIITMDGGSILSGGDGFQGRLNITGEGTVTANGVLNADSIHIQTSQSQLTVRNHLFIQNGGSFLLSDDNEEKDFGAIISSEGEVKIGGVFGVDLDVNNMFQTGTDTKEFLLFKGAQGMVVYKPELDVNEGQSVRFDLDLSMQEFFTLNQEHFVNTGKVSITRKEMTCYLLDPSDVTGSGAYVDEFRSPNSTSYLGANKNNDGNMHDGVLYPKVFFYEKNYMIAEGDNAYRLTDGEAWMNFHVKMTDQQLDAPTKLVIRSRWMTPEERVGGVILSIRGNADNTYSGGTQIFQTKVKVDGTLNRDGSVPMPAGDVYFFGTGAVEAIGTSAEIRLNTGGDGSTAEYLFYNDIQLQQGAVVTQSSSKNVLMGNLSVKDYATLANLTNEDLILSGSRLNGNNLKIQGADGIELNTILKDGIKVNPKFNTIRLEGVTGEKVNAKFTTVDIDKRGQLDVGRNATANITSLYIDQGSSVTMTEGGLLAVKEIKNGAHGRGEVILAGGTFKAMGDFAITENGATYRVTSASTFDTNGYYMEINQFLTEWSDFTVTGGGKIRLMKDLSSFDAHATITGDSTNVTISKDKTLAGSWTVKDGGTLKTEENVSIRGILNMEKGGFTDFGVGTWMNLATLNFKEGSTYSGFLKGDDSTVNFEDGSHFQVKTEDLRKLTDGTEKAFLLSSVVNITNGKGFFNFSGGDGIINDAIIDSGVQKTLIIGTEELNVGGLGDSATRTGSLGLSASELTAEQLATMVGETNYRWLSFVLTAEEVGEAGSKINVTVTRNVNFSELAETSNEAAIAPALSYIGMEGGKADSKLQGEELNQLGLALTKATGDAHQMLSNISLSTSSIMAGYSVQRENLRRHTLELRDRAVQERPCALRNQYETLENTVWASGQGGTYSVDGDNNAVGHTTTLWGGQLGVSRCVNDNLVLGLAFTYTTSDINLDQGMGKATNDAYYIDLYAKYHKDNWNVTGIVTGGFTDLSTERNMSIEGFSSRTKGSSSGNQLMGMVEVGYEFDLDGDRSNIIEPFAALTAGYSSIDGFEETGAGSAGLNVASQSDTSCSLGAGVRYVKEFSTSSDELLRGRFEVRAMILQDLTDNEVDVEASFIGANGHGFTQKSTEIGKTGFLLGTGVVVPISVNMSFFADLNGEFRSSETGCNANIGVKYNF